MTKYIQLVKPTPGASGYVLVDWYYRALNQDRIESNSDSHKRDISFANTNYFEITAEVQNDIVSDISFLIPYIEIQDGESVSRHYGTYSAPFVNDPTTKICKLSFTFDAELKSKNAKMVIIKKGPTALNYETAVLYSKPKATVIFKIETDDGTYTQAENSDSFTINLNSDFTYQATATILDGLLQENKIIFTPKEALTE